MRKALIVGIDFYDSGRIGNLFGCVTDAYSMKSVLDRHSDGTRNFDVKLLTATNEDSKITKKNLKDNVKRLFEDDSEVALFYFSGHGYVESVGGYLISSDCNDGDDGLAMNELLKLVNDSPAKNKIVILDTCHSGVFGNVNPGEGTATLKEGVTILTASSETQYALEENGSGVFTSLFVDALNGSASSLIGDVTPGGVYAHIDKTLGFWEQRPIFKTNVKSFVVLRKTQPSISLDDLKHITNLFPRKGYEFNLDPSFEPESDCPNEENNNKFAILQKYNRLNLLVPIDAPHMYHAAMESKSCKLTVLGEHYWSLVDKERI